MAYLGKSPSQGVRNRYYFTASGGETSISGALTGGTLTFSDGAYVDVMLNGVTLVAGTDYNTTTANTIAGLTALSASDIVEIVVYDVFSVFSGNVNSDFNVGEDLTVSGSITSSAGATITTADNSTQLTLKSTDADAAAGPRFDLTRDSSSPADGDNLGRIRYMFDNDAAEQTEGVRLDAVLTDASDGTEDVSYVLSTRAGGSVGERIRIDSDGLKFNGDTAAANGLDDYEEGTWTPVGNAASGGNPTFTVSSAHYTRIGRNVHVTAILTDVNTTGTTSNQVFRIGGLPYTPDTADTFGSVVTSLIDMDNVNSSVVMADASENVLTFFNQRHNQGGATPQLGRTNIDHQHIIDDESDFYFSITYITNQ